MPKLKKSANVSNSLPMREVELSARARRPSRPSRIMATTSAITAMSIRPSSAKRTDVRPTQTAPNVIKLGNSANGRTRPLACVRSRSSGSVTWQPQGEPAVGLSVLKRFHPHGFLTETNGWAHTFWKINIESATKANQSKAIAGAQFRAFFDKTDNASSNEPRNLCNADSETVISEKS